MKHAAVKVRPTAPLTVVLRNGFCFDWFHFCRQKFSRFDLPYFSCKEFLFVKLLHHDALANYCWQEDTTKIAIKSRDKVLTKILMWSRWLQQQQLQRGHARLEGLTSWGNKAIKTPHTKGILWLILFVPKHKTFKSKYVCADIRRLTLFRWCTNCTGGETSLKRSQSSRHAGWSAEEEISCYCRY